MTSSTLVDAPIRQKGKTAHALKAYTLSKASEMRWDVVYQYLPLVKSLVSRMRIFFPADFDKEDIYSIAITGLIDAVKQFDPAKSESFGAYAKIRVRGALLDELRKIDWLSREDRSTTKKYNQAVEELEQSLMRKPTPEEICQSLELSTEQFLHINQLRTPVSLVPLDAPCGCASSEAPLLHDIVSDPTQSDSRDLCEHHELIENLQDSLESLDPTKKKVLALYYLEGLRLAEIAQIMGVTESRICQIHAEALSELRKSLNAKLMQ